MHSLTNLVNEFVGDDSFLLAQSREKRTRVHKASQPHFTQLSIRHWGCVRTDVSVPFSEDGNHSLTDPIAHLFVSVSQVWPEINTCTFTQAVTQLSIYLQAMRAESECLAGDLDGSKQRVQTVQRDWQQWASVVQGLNQAHARGHPWFHSRFDVHGIGGCLARGLPVIRYRI